MLGIADRLVDRRVNRAAPVRVRHTRRFSRRIRRRIKSSRPGHHRASASATEAFGRELLILTSVICALGICGHRRATRGLYIQGFIALTRPCEMTDRR
jgi:hypothetical protein